MALPKKLKDLNLFSNGESWQGIVQSITLPTLTRKIEEWRGGGMDGAVGIDMGQDGLLTVQWTVGGLVESLFDNFGTARIDAPLGPVPHQRLGSVIGVHQNGKPSVSHVTLVERRQSTSIVAIRIETGRAHQIRIHLAAAGFPLEGDPLYPPGGIPPEDTRALPGETGYFLHAKRLRFPHPADGQSVSVDCMPPPALRRSI